MTEMPVLEVRDVTYSFGASAILDGISMSVYAGQVACLIGPSGCGKTTLLRIIAGLLLPKKGRIRIAGADVSRIPTHRLDLGFVFQSELALFPHLDVRENIEFPFRYCHRRKLTLDSVAAVNEIIQRTGLQAHSHKKINELSGGLKQRVAIARALVYRPAILLLDEPLSSLDNPRKEELLTLLKELKATGQHTFLYVTHDDREVKAIADTVAVLHNGTIIRDGSLATVLAERDNDVVKKLLKPIGA